MASRKKPKKRWGWVLPAIGTVVLGTVAAFGSGLGSRVGGSIGSDEPPLVSYSVELLEGECRGGEYVPRASLPSVLNAASRYDWGVLERQPGAAQANLNPVQVAIQGGSGRTITLTRIEFSVTRSRRPAGAGFIGACGDAFVGRSLMVDLDHDPPRIVESNAAKGGTLGARASNGERLYRPILFPWTVSVSDPLLLEILAATSSCNCTWTAEIPWVSGNSRGTIVIDNEGEGFRVVGTEGLPVYAPGSHGWRRWRG